MRKKTLMNLKKKHQEGPAATPAPPGYKDAVISLQVKYLSKHYTL